MIKLYYGLLNQNNLTSIDDVKDYLFYTALKCVTTNKSGFISLTEVQSITTQLKVSRSSLYRNLNRLIKSGFITKFPKQGYRLHAIEKINHKLNFNQYTSKTKANKNKYAFEKIESLDLKNLDIVYINQLLLQSARQQQCKKKGANNIAFKQPAKTLELIMSLRTLATKGIFNKLPENVSLPYLHRLLNKAEKLKYFSIARGKQGLGHSGIANTIIWNTSPTSLPKPIAVSNVRNNFTYSLTTTRKASKPKLSLVNFLFEKKEHNPQLVNRFYNMLEGIKSDLIDVGILKPIYKTRKVSKPMIGNILSAMYENHKNVLSLFFDLEKEIEIQEYSDFLYDYSKGFKNRTAIKRITKRRIYLTYRNDMK